MPTSTILAAAHSSKGQVRSSHKPLAVDDVEGDQGEGGWVAGEADRIGGAANWPLRVSSGMPAFSAATTSSQATPEGRTRWRSSTKARRSLLPCRPRVTSVTQERLAIPEHLHDRQQRPALARTSWMATTSKRWITSAMHSRLLRSRMGESPGTDRHLGVIPSKARTFQVPISRFCPAC